MRLGALSIKILKFYLLPCLSVEICSKIDRIHYPQTDISTSVYWYRRCKSSNIIKQTEVPRYLIDLFQDRDIFCACNTKFPELSHSRQYP